MVTDSSQAEKEIRRRMLADGTHEIAVRTFLRHYHELINGDCWHLPDARIQPVDDLPEVTGRRDLLEGGRRALHRLACIKLSGGLGTSMGLKSPKVLLPLRDNLTFLDISVRQILSFRQRYHAGLPLMFMTSYITDGEIAAALRRYPELSSGQPGLPLTFRQNRVPRILADDHTPLSDAGDPRGWCPPGHGDFYTVIFTSGILNRLLEGGRRYAFISNGDNLGATVNLHILGYLAAHRIPFLMEATERTPADRKGGHLALSNDGRLLLRESAQCPPDERESFQNIRRFRYFNTNNIWIDLEQLADVLRECDGVLDLPLMINTKPLDPHQPDSPRIHQLETALGAAVALFPEARAVRVGRERFAPVKTTNDLLAVRSDAYRLDADFNFNLDPSRDAPPIVTLDPAFFALLKDFDRRFPAGPPSLLHCRKLRLEGDFLFGSDVVLAGEIALRNRSRHQIIIPDHTRIRVESAGETGQAGA